jgi:hypothetical protein
MAQFFDLGLGQRRGAGTAATGVRFLPDILQHSDSDGDGDSDSDGDGDGDGDGGGGGVSCHTLAPRRASITARTGLPCAA